MSTEEPGDQRRTLGARGEQHAVEYLEEAGWEILERNWSVRMGEVDVIASRQEQRYGQPIEQVIFVEVKTRHICSQRARPEASVTRRKRERLTRLAALWRSSERAARAPVALRFDVIAVDMERAGAGERERFELRHIVGAFDACGRIV